MNKVIKWMGVVILILVIFVGYLLFAPNIFPVSEEKGFLCIPDSSTFKDVQKYLQRDARVLNFKTFNYAAHLMHYGDNIHPGRYQLKTAMNNFQLIRLLRSGRQTPVKLTFNNIRTKEQLAGRLGKQLMADSLNIMKVLNDTAFLSKYGLNPDNAIVLFIPNTYQIFWNVTAKKLVERMDKEYNKFWTPERRAKAAAIPLQLPEVSTLASIVEEETNNKKDQPMVAGLYINRLKVGMPLQADPTIKFALGDFSLKRILSGNLRVNSPYNTYRNLGLPPGPIRVASERGIDAVLNYNHHNYIYMCASETLNGEHKFAVTWKEHVANAKKYRQTLNELKIFK